MHPDVIGLWGVGTSPSFDARLIYDGCCVTLRDSGLMRMTMSIDMASERLMYGRPANYGVGNRTYAVWRGNTLLSDSHLGLLTVGLREVLDDGTARLAWVEPRHYSGEVPDTTHPLVRFGPTHCVDRDTSDMLCARLIVPGARHAGTTTAPAPESCPHP